MKNSYIFQNKQKISESVALFCIFLDLFDIWFNRGWVLISASIFNPLWCVVLLEIYEEIQSSYRYVVAKRRTLMGPLEGPQGPSRAHPERHWFRTAPWTMKDLAPTPDSIQFSFPVNTWLLPFLNKVTVPLVRIKSRVAIGYYRQPSVFATHCSVVWFSNLFHCITQEKKIHFIYTAHMHTSERKVL